MTRRRTLAVATATTLLAGLGTFGATTAFASSPAPTPSAGGTASATASRTGDAKNLDAMLQRCVKHLPAKDRAETKKLMRDMMSGRSGSMMSGRSGSMMGGRSGSMMGGGSGTSTGGMMHGASGTSTGGMMQGLGDGS